MRKVWLIIALFLIVLPAAILFFALNPLSSMEAASQAGIPPTAAFKSGGSGFPLVEQIHQGYDNSTPDDAPILLRQAPLGPYESGEQLAWGNVQHRLAGEAEVLHLTPNFKVAESKAPEIVLTESDVPDAAEISAAPVLAKLSVLEGSQDFDVLPDQVFGAVVIYDRAQDSVLAIARLEPEPVCGDVPSRWVLADTRPSEAPTTCVAIDRTEGLNKTGTPPEEVDIEAYRVEVDGAVDRTLSLSFDDLRAYPATSEVVLLVCSGFFADNVEWTGVPLSTIFEEAGAQPDYKAVRVESGSDGYWVSLEQDQVDPEDVILAYQVNGEDIPLDHGYPVRLVIRGEYGSKWVKWVKHIEVLEK